MLSFHFSDCIWKSLKIDKNENGYSYCRFCFLYSQHPISFRYCAIISAVKFDFTFNSWASRCLLEPCQTSMMERFTIITLSFQKLCLLSTINYRSSSLTYWLKYQKQSLRVVMKCRSKTNAMKNFCSKVTGLGLPVSGFTVGFTGTRLYGWISVFTFFQLMHV